MVANSAELEQGAIDHEEPKWKKEKLKGELLPCAPHRAPLLCVLMYAKLSSTLDRSRIADPCGPHARPRLPTPTRAAIEMGATHACRSGAAAAARHPRLLQEGTEEGAQSAADALSRLESLQHMRPHLLLDMRSLTLAVVRVRGKCPC